MVQESNATNQGLNFEELEKYLEYKITFYQKKYKATKKEVYCGALSALVDMKTDLNKGCEE